MRARRALLPETEVHGGIVLVGIGDTVMRGGDFYDRQGAAERYLRHRHGGTSSPNVVMEEPAFLARLGSVAGRRILDLGCGDGSFGAWALDVGAASYRGVDASAEMTRRALARLRGTGAEVVRQDIAEVRAPAGSFDLVVSRMALHYLPDLGPVLARCRTWLPPGGRLIFSVVHPVITAPAAPPAYSGPRSDWTVDNYFEPGERRRDWFGHQVLWHHRSVEQYVTAVLCSGFTLTALQECPPSGGLLADRPEELHRRRRVPLFLLRGPMPTTHTVRVPGAQLYVERRGTGPVILLTGSPMPAADFAGLADALAADYTVITHDPRGIGASVLDDLALDSLPDSRADDLAAILDAVGVESADVFGSSGGAVTGLALVARHPERVHTLVAHEPPVVRLLPDPDAEVAAFARIAETFRREGPGPAFLGFLKHVGFTRPAPAADSATQAPSAQALADAARFLGREMLDTVGYLPDVAALAAERPRVVVAVGADSTHLLTYATSMALVTKLGTAPVIFPGDHTGFCADPLGFAHVLRGVLAG